MENKYILTYEGFRQRKRRLKLKHRKEREEQEKSDIRRIEQEKMFGKDDPVNPGETISRLK